MEDGSLKPAAISWKNPGWMGILFVILLAGCGGVGSSWPGLQVAEDILYVADLTHVIAVDARSGQELWRFPPKDGNAGACPGSYHAAPAVLEGWVVIAAEDPGRGKPPLWARTRKGRAAVGISAIGSTPPGPDFCRPDLR